MSHYPIVIVVKLEKGKVHIQQERRLKAIEGERVEECRRVGHLKLIRLRDRGRGKEERGEVRVNGRINEANNWIS